VIDGASEDGTLDILNKYAELGWLWYRTEADAGIYNAMNKGIALAKGKYVAFLNSDDYYHNKKAVELSVESLENARADYSYANYRVVGRGQRYTEKAVFDRFICTMPFGHPTMFTKRSVLLKEEGFDEALGLPSDYDLVIRLILGGYKPVYVDSLIVSYRLGGASVTTDYSDDVARIYLKNYSSFFSFSGPEEAKRIFLEKVLPRDFLAALESFLKKNRVGGVDIGKTLQAVKASAQFKNLGKKEKFKNILSHYPMTAILIKGVRGKE